MITSHRNARVTNLGLHDYIYTDAKKLRSASDIKRTVLLKKAELATLVICKNLLTIMIISRNDSNNDYNMHMYEKNKLTIISIFK